MTADGAYDTRRCHNAIADRGAAAVKGRTVRQLICATEPLPAVTAWHLTVTRWPAAPHKPLQGPLRAPWPESGTTSTMNAQSSHRPPERLVERHGAGLAVLGVVGLYARHRGRYRGAGDGMDCGARRCPRVRAVPKHLLWHRRRTGGQTGQRVQLLRHLDQQTGSVKNQSGHSSADQSRDVWITRTIAISSAPPVCVIA